MRSAYVIAAIAALSAVACGAASTQSAAANVAVLATPKKVYDTLIVAPAPRVAAGSDEEMTLPCSAEGDDAKAALAQINALDAKIRALPANASAAPLMTELEEILAGPCMKLATRPATLAADTGLSLQTFWEAGGQLWLESQLALGADREDHALFIAPTTETTLASDVNTSSPLLPLLCPANDARVGAHAACGTETLGWVMRANDSYERHANAERARFFEGPEPFPPTRLSCEKAAVSSTEESAFYTYSNCISESVVKTDALPLGRFKAPKDGWLVLRGRRGHYAFCDGISAFDLASGSFYSVKMCGGMFVSRSSNGAQTSPQIEATTGRVPIDAIREAALMIMLTDTAQKDVVMNGWGWTMPKGLKIQAPPMMIGAFGSSGGGWSSGRTVLEASWIRGGVSQVRASVHFPDSDDAVYAHTTELLAIAEAAMTPGCAPAKLPKIPWDAPGPRISDKTFMPTYDDQAIYPVLEAALDALRSRPSFVGCK